MKLQKPFKLIFLTSFIYCVFYLISIGYKPTLVFENARFEFFLPFNYLLPTNLIFLFLNMGLDKDIQPSLQKLYLGTLGVIYIIGIIVYFLSSGDSQRSGGQAAKFLNCLLTPVSPFFMYLLLEYDIRFSLGKDKRMLQNKAIKYYDIMMSYILELKQKTETNQ